SRPGDDYSSAETFNPPAAVNYNYPLDVDSAYLPLAQDWIYTANPPTSLATFAEGSAQRLPNGNTMICGGTNPGRFIEVDSLSDDIWKYVNPVSMTGPVQQGQTPSMNTCFRVTYLPFDYPGLAGHDLSPGGTLELNPLSYYCDNFSTAVEPVIFDEKKINAYPNPFTENFMIRL